jgi:H+/Cl- antiporter ClcA
MENCGAETRAEPDPQAHPETQEDESTGEAPAEDIPYSGPDHRLAQTAGRALGDFTASAQLLRLVLVAVVIGALSAGISIALLDMIGFVTSLVYYQRVSVRLVSPDANTLGLLAVVIPVGGGHVVGLMARFGSEQIRGHGIPEAMERILIHGSKVQPRLAVLKPISSAVSIGTGGPSACLPCGVSARAVT